jgi:hypothetical protein
VVYADKDGLEQLQAAKVVCVAGNSMELGVEPVPGRARQLLGAGRAN